jgi:MoxR-like ATPase
MSVRGPSVGANGEEGMGGLSSIRRLEAELAAGFVGREEEARVAVLALLTKSHAVFIGEPGTAKSALIRRLSQLVNCRFFYYLLSKYTVPDELVGAIDPIAYKEGRFVRNTKGKLPDVEIAFIDEIFKGPSETLNAILHIMNERIFVDVDGTVYNCPLHSLFGASNELPVDSELAAFFDRFLLRHFVKGIPSNMLESAIIHNLRLNSETGPIVSLDDINRLYDKVTAYMRANDSALARVTAQFVVMLRQHGIFVSDRTAVSPNHLPRLIATYAYVYGADLRSAAMAVSKYVLPNEEAVRKYREMLDSFYPAELRDASDKLEKAKNYAASGDLQAAKRFASESLQLARAFLSRPEKAELFKEEVKNVIASAEQLLNEIQQIEERLSRYRKGGP